MPPKWWDPMMSRVIAVMACGLTVAACSSISSVTSLNFLKPSPTTEGLRVESEPPGAEAKSSQGQSCRTPCELTVQTGTELSVTLALNGYQPQTVSVRPEGTPAVQRDGESATGSSTLAPNPVYVELQPAPAATPVKKPVRKKKPVAAAARPAATAAAAPPTTTASVPSAAPPPMPTTAAEPAASGTNYPWPSR
jgi:hypothetical protein